MAVIWQCQSAVFTLRGTPPPASQLPHRCCHSYYLLPLPPCSKPTAMLPHLDADPEMKEHKLPADSRSTAKTRANHSEMKTQKPTAEHSGTAKTRANHSEMIRSGRSMHLRQCRRQRAKAKNRKINICDAKTIGYTK